MGRDRACRCVTLPRLAASPLLSSTSLHAVFPLSSQPALLRLPCPLVRLEEPGVQDEDGAQVVRILGGCQQGGVVVQAQPLQAGWQRLGAGANRLGRRQRRWQHRSGSEPVFLPI